MLGVRIDLFIFTGEQTLDHNSLSAMMESRGENTSFLSKDDPYDLSIPRRSPVIGSDESWCNANHCCQSVCVLVRRKCQSLGITLFWPL